MSLAACGDDKGSTAATTAAPVAAPAATTATPTTPPSTVPAQKFKVMVTGDFTSPGFAVPESAAAAKSVLKDVPGLEIVECDSKGDINASQACERKAVDEKVVAVVNGLGTMARGHDILTKAGIPIVGTTQETKTATTAFAVSSGIGSYAALGIGVAQAGCKRVATIYTQSGGEVLPNIIKSGAIVSGSTEVARSGVPDNAPDLSAPVAKLLDANPDCIVLSLPPTMVVQAVTAIQQSGKKVALAGVSAIFPPATLASLGAKAEGILIPAIQLDPTDPAPAIQEIKQAIASTDKDAKFTSTSVLTWASAKVLATAVANIKGDITAASTLASLTALRDVDLHGAIHSYSSIEMTNPLVARTFNHYAINYKIVNGKFARQGDFYDLKPVLDNLKF
ncbi:MAG: putative substrate-binding transporter protein component [Acidimicrobiia bacterium]|nr:putative substrate-binding transporter protein component [Acidimicrobiia bacterium]